MNMFNAIPDMIQNEDFNAMSRIAIVNNDDVEDVLEDETEHEIESETDDKLEDETGDGTSYGKIQVPSTYTNLEETDIAIDDNLMMPNSKSKSDFIRELGIDSFNDKEEFVRAVKLYNIKTHKHYEGRPRSTRLRNGMDIKERKKFNLCGICKRPGHNRATCLSKPRRMDA
ncbi:hypothetical protein QVD17_30350 [Tagetes erecta]|uniref:Uncharacterized protein n=1 Tax=Tagetes erecta TaxID=13708 RepID=A0AAD8NNC2_TARER|nr:hypothetical protein QVD17_30350 [Tagetes erecta]